MKAMKSLAGRRTRFANRDGEINVRPCHPHLIRLPPNAIVRGDASNIRECWEDVLLIVPPSCQELDRRLERSLRKRCTPKGAKTIAITMVKNVLNPLMD